MEYLKLFTQDPEYQTFISGGGGVSFLADLILLFFIESPPPMYRT